MEEAPGGRRLLFVLPVAMPMPTRPVRAMSSLESLLVSKLGLVPAALLDPGPEEVLGLAAMVKGFVLVAAVFLEGGGGSGRSR